MKTVFKPSSWLSLAAAAAVLGLGLAGAQETPPATAPSASSAPPQAGKASKSGALIDAGEPRADTSAVDVPAVAAAPAATARGAAGPDTAARGRSGAHPAEVQPVAAPVAGPPLPPHPGSASSAPKAAGPKAPAAADRLDLNTATVTGDREQPKVMYIVPWKKADIGDLSGKPMNSLLDEALAPVDRDEFRREVAYYGALKADSPQNGASGTAPQAEK